MNTQRSCDDAGLSIEALAGKFQGIDALLSEERKSVVIPNDSDFSRTATWEV